MRTAARLRTHEGGSRALAHTLAAEQSWRESVKSALRVSRVETRADRPQILLSAIAESTPTVHRRLLERVLRDSQPDHRPIWTHGVFGDQIRDVLPNRQCAHPQPTIARRTQYRRTEPAATKRTVLSPRSQRGKKET